MQVSNKYIDKYSINDDVIEHRSVPSQSLRNNASSNLNIFDTLPTMSDQYRNKHGGVKPKHVNTLEIKQLHAGKKYTHTHQNHHSCNCHR